MSRPSKDTCPDVDKILQGLKDFQRRSVDYAFKRMYLDENPTSRFLVADEVGLGKSLVARGLIAKVMGHLWDKKKSITVLYICSNSDIARQNIQRLNVFEDTENALPTRLTLVPSQLRNLGKNKINFISFTPGTSFELKKRGGLVEERVLLFWLLKSIWNIGSGVSAKNVLQATAKPASFREKLNAFDQSTISPLLKREFKSALKDDDRACKEEGRPTLKSRFKTLEKQIARARLWKNFPREIREEVAAVIGELRALLAATCIRSIAPDLIILDEFQRFKNLLDGNDEAGKLAEKLFEWEGAHVLMLSATPYKMYTNAHDVDDHYQDFLETIRFLDSKSGADQEIERLLKRYRLQLHRLGEDKSVTLVEEKRALEASLKQFMIRTERLAASPDRNGMLVERMISTVLKDVDLKAYVSLHEVIQWLENDQEDSLIGSQIEFWKSAPYLLNFMDHENYGFKSLLHKTLNGMRRGTLRSRSLTECLNRASDTLLDGNSVDRYQQVPSKNPRLEHLMEDVLEHEGCPIWKLLWLPPTAPYYRLSGPYGGLADDTTRVRLTKRLIFSNWRVVPKVVATLLSYEVERRQYQSYPNPKRRYSDEHTRRARLMEFSRSKGRLTGMPVLGMIYPCLVLANECDPLRLGAKQISEGSTPSKKELLDLARVKLEALLKPLLKSAEKTDLPDYDWYWAAPLLLDAHYYPEATQGWFNQKELASAWRGKAAGRSKDRMEDSETEHQGDTAWTEHVERARAVAFGNAALKLGRPPNDLVNVLAEMAIAGPGVVALRAFGRVCEESRSVRQLSAPIANEQIRSFAGSVGWAVRRLFKFPEVTAMIRGVTDGDDESYWQKVLGYCVDGCLQAVLDEYVHLLTETEGLAAQNDVDKVSALAERLTNVIGLRASLPHFDEFKAGDKGSVEVESRSMRARFAMLFGEEDQGSGLRRETMRSAFNSPFYPFVLATTSVGQEGLDFHHYCHAVVHWNLPANPVDLEQREGRVHRYKGHAIRKNVASRHFSVVGRTDAADPWQAMFAAAHESRGQDTDLVPYWIYPLEEGAFIERHLPMLPFSRDQQALPELRKALTIYRMVFGQPRQDDLIDFLRDRIPEHELTEVLEKVLIDLTP